MLLQVLPLSSTARMDSRIHVTSRVFYDKSCELNTCPGDGSRCDV